MRNTSGWAWSPPISTGSRARETPGDITGKPSRAWALQRAFQGAQEDAPIRSVAAGRRAGPPDVAALPLAMSPEIS